MTAFPKFDSWAGIAKPDPTRAKVAKAAKVTSKSSNFSNFSSFSRGAPQNLRGAAQAIGVWTANDWVVFFHKRAGIAQHDGGLSKDDAEGFAYDACLVAWQNHNPEPSKPGSCAHCGGAEVTETTLIPVLAGDAHTWLHDGCHRQWMARQKDRATSALAEIGIALSAG